MGKIKYVIADVKKEKGNFLDRRQPRNVITVKIADTRPPCSGCGKEPRRATSAYGEQCAANHAALQHQTP